MRINTLSDHCSVRGHWNFNETECSAIARCQKFVKLQYLHSICFQATRRRTTNKEIAHDTFLHHHTFKNSQYCCFACGVNYLYRKVVYKSRGLCAIFEHFGAASIQLRLLFEGGLYAKSWVCKTRKSGLAHVKWKQNLTLRLFHNYFKCKQTFGMRNAVGFSPTSTTLRRCFRAAASIRVQLLCNLSSEKVLFECGF